MNNYEKPVVQVNESAAEGVYAASGTNTDGPRECESQYMGGVYQAPKYGWNTTVKEYYGCTGCSAGWGGECHCPTYEYRGETLAPDWEKQYNRLPGDPIDDNNPKPY